jgi:hypothetical protein
MMRQLAVIAVVLGLFGCGKVTKFTDGGDDDDTIDAKAATIDATPFVCDDQACTDGDECCPAACNANNDGDCSGVCDNGVLENGELCDPLATCETSCPAIGCQLRDLTGTGCQAHCTNGGQQSACQDGDGCCPSGCNANNDLECAATCDNGSIESGELCDPLASCPTSCPQIACGLYDLFNAGTCQAQCVLTGTQGACQSGDNCCPSGCNANNDNDCAPACGNNVIEAGEGCDGNCPVCTETQTCYTQSNAGPCQIPTCHLPQTSCGVSGDSCCAFDTQGGCSSGNDGECSGPAWQFRQFPTVGWATAGQCSTVTMYPEIDAFGSYDFTFCQPPGFAAPSGDPVITSVVDDLGNSYNVTNDDCSDATALPRLAGWSCNNDQGSQVMSCASMSPGGFKPRGAPQRITLTVCPYSASTLGRGSLWVWYNARNTPNPG